MKLFLLFIFLLPSIGAGWMIFTAPKRRSKKQVAQFKRWEAQMNAPKTRVPHGVTDTYRQRGTVTYDWSDHNGR